MTLTPTTQEFIERVKQELTVACAVPFDLKAKEITRLIEDAYGWFTYSYEDSVEDRLYVIPVSSFSVPLFKAKRVLPLPTCVVAVNGVKKLREDFLPSFSFDGTTDITAEKVIFKDSANLGYGSESLMYYALNLYWIDLASHILNHTVSWTFNKNTGLLFFGGETPNRDIVVQCQTKIPLDDLMKDHLFYRYVVAKAKIQLSRMIGTFDFSLVGNVKINYELVREEGKEELQEVKDRIKGDNAMDFFFTSGGG
jgi:hypothetical protein